jgi:hypothetical protein
MKKLVVAASLLAAFGAAHADLTLVGGVGTAIVGFGVGNIIPGVLPQDYGLKVDGVTSFINSTVGAPLYLTYMGKEADNLNEFLYNGTVIFNPGMVPPQTVATVESVGKLNFSFAGSATAETAIYAVLGKAGPNGAFTPYKGEGTGFKFDYVLGFNDKGSADGDYDDVVIGVSATNPIPEPSTYALMAAGLGAVGFVARRRQRKS